MRNLQKGRNIGGDMYQNSTIIKNTAIDELKQLLIDKDIDGAMSFLGMQSKFIGTQHPYYPDFMISVKEENGNFIPYSKPITEKAMSEMKPSLSGTFSFSDRYSKFKSAKEVFDYSYHTQSDIEINVISLKRMLGDKDDPYQGDLKELLDGTVQGEWKIKHKEFPPSKPFKIFMDEHESLLDYILLRATRIEGTTVSLSNYEQETDLDLEFLFDLRQRSMRVNISIRESYEYNYESQLKFLNFIKGALNKSILHIYSLEEGVEMAQGRFDAFDYQSSFGEVEYEIDFIESILVIEKKYDRKIIVPENISEESYENVMILAEGISNGKIEGKWTDLNTELVIIKESKVYFEGLSEEPERLTFEHTKSLIIFEEEFIIPKIIIHFMEVKFQDVKKIKEKLKVLDTGDVIKVKMIPGTNQKYIQEFYFD